MSFLLDTKVVSELRKRPEVVDERVVDWVTGHPAREMFISAITVLEIELGVARVERRDGRQDRLLREWMNSGVLAGFDGRVLPVDTEIAVLNPWAKS